MDRRVTPPKQITSPTWGQHQHHVNRLLISRTTTLLGHHTFLYISFLLLHDYDVKMPSFTFYGGREQSTTKFSFSLKNSPPEDSAWIWQSKRAGIIAMEIERTRTHFEATSPSCYLNYKLPWRIRVAHWWKHSPPTNVAWVRIQVSTPYVGWVCCWFSPLLRGVFLRVLRCSPLLKNQHFQIPIRSGTYGQVSARS